MVRYNTTLAALCAIILSLVAVTDSWGQAPITNQEVYDSLRVNPVFTPPAGRGEFEGDGNGDLFFPPTNEWAGDPWFWDDLDPDIYTLNLTDGRTFTFNGSLTIQEYAVDGGNAIGRIKVLGEAPGVGQGMVTLDEAEEEGWGGILVTTFPDGDNEISYCEVTNSNGHGVQIGTGALTGQCVVEKSLIHHNGVNGVQVLGPDGGSDYSINSNVVHDNGWRGIQVDGAFDGEHPELAVVNNVVYNNTSDGIQLHNSESTISVRNNIVYGNGGSQIELFTASNNPRIHNNVLDGENDGINVFDGWSNEIRNNIIVNCNVGIQGTQEENEVFYFCLLFDNGTPFVDCAPGAFCIIGNNPEHDPQFVDDVNDDYHLLWESPAINAGDPSQDPDYRDPDLSCNDMGAFGGQRAGSFNREDFEDYCAIPENFEFEDESTLRYDTYWMLGDCNIPDGNTLTISPGVTVILLPGVEFKVEGTLDARGTTWDQGQRILFKPNLSDIDYNQPFYVWSTDRHDGIYFYEAEDIRLKYFRIWGSDRFGIKSKDTTNFIDFDCVRCDHNEGDGLYIVGSSMGYTDITIEDCDFWYNGSDGIAVINNYEFASIDGGYAMNNDAAGVRITDYSLDYFDGFTSEENGFYGISMDNAEAWISNVIANNNHKHGFMHWYDSSTLYGCFAEDNDGNGVYCYYSCDPIVSGCRIANNGADGDDSNGNTAEIKLLGYTSRVDIKNRHNDIWDVNVVPGDDPQQECLVFTYVPTPITSPIEGTGNYWGLTAGVPDSLWWKCFKPGGDPSVGGNIMDSATFPGANNEPYIVSIEYANEAKRLYEEARRYELEGEYNRSIPLYIRIIEEYPESSAAYLSPKRLSVCWRKAERDLSDLITFLGQFECPEEASILEDEIFFALNLCRRVNGDLDTAISSLSDRIEEPRNRLDSLRAIRDREMLFIYLLEENEDHIDKMGDRIRDHNNQIDNMGDRIRYHKNQIAYYEDLMEQYAAGSEEAKSTNFPETFIVARAYPNPFNSMTNITFNLHEESHVKLTIHDLQGREVVLLHEGQETAGVYAVSWDASGFASGVYICRLQSNSKTATIKLAMMR